MKKEEKMICTIIIIAVVFVNRHLSMFCFVNEREEIEEKRESQFWHTEIFLVFWVSIIMIFNFKKASKKKHNDDDDNVNK